MSEQNITPEVEREEVELPTVPAGGSPTGDKKPLKLRVSPKLGKQLNPTVRFAAMCVIVFFVGLIFYGIMSRGKKKAAEVAAAESSSVAAAGMTGNRVWQDMDEQRKADAAKAAKQLTGVQGSEDRQLVPGDAANGSQQQGQGVPNTLVARGAKDAVVPPLVAHPLTPPGRSGGVESTVPALNAPTRPGAGRQQMESGSVDASRRSPQDEWREQMYKSELAAREAGTGISQGRTGGGGNPLAALASAATGGPGSSIRDLLAQYQPGGASVSVPGMAGRGNSDESEDPNWQEKKEGFIEKNRQKRIEGDYLAATRSRPLSRYEIKAGWDIPATLESAVNTDLPGEVKAVVRENVFDTASGKYLLIPQGARLVGRYDSRIAYGQGRAVVIWTRLIFPDGSSVDLDGMIGHDASGAGGFHDKVNNHYVRLVSGALMLSAFTAGISMSQPQTTSASGYLSPSQQATQALGQQMGQLGIEMTKKNLNIQPTIQIRVGYRFNVRVNKDIAFAEPYRDGR